MAKHRKHKSSSSANNNNNERNNNPPSSAPQHHHHRQHQEDQQQSTKPLPLHQWLWRGNGMNYVVTFFIFGSIIGFFMGAFYHDKDVAAHNIRSTDTFRFFRLQGRFWDNVHVFFEKWMERIEHDIETEEFLSRPANPRVFAVLREAIVREDGGYVYPDLGLMHPAPSGAVRGLGMVSDRYYQCQSKCMAGTHEERRTAEMVMQNNGTASELPPETTTYRQEEVLIRVPLSYQMTRKTALDLLLTLIPADVQRKASLHELDDAALLVMLLAHERAVGRYSRWMPYIASLPPEPSCGYSRRLRPYMLDALEAYRNEMGVETEGWEEELIKATHYGERIADGLNNDYGEYLGTPDHVESSLENIQWALCQVASRATAGNEKHGALRMVPMVDMINHDINAGGFFELTGKERVKDGDFLDATESDSGTFVVRSLRHGRRKPLKKGQELMANYNVPHFSPLDWFVSLGFVPPERWTGWVKIDPVLPRVRSDGPFSDTPEQTWETRDAAIRQHLKNSEL